MRVDKMNLLKLAPGGHVGRFCIWTKSAFGELNNLFGTSRKSSTIKKNYHLQRSKMTNVDLSQLLKSEAIRRVCRPAQYVSVFISFITFLGTCIMNFRFCNCRKKVVRAVKKKNPLKNTRALLGLNPFAAVSKRAAIIAAKNRKVKIAKLVAERTAAKAAKAAKVAA